MSTVKVSVPATVFSTIDGAASPEVIVDVVVIAAAFAAANAALEGVAVNTANAGSISAATNI